MGDKTLLMSQISRIGAGVGKTIICGSLAGGGISATSGQFLNFNGWYTSMKTLTCTFVSAVALLLQVGCNQSPSTSQATSTSPSNSTSPPPATPTTSSTPDNAGQDKKQEPADTQSPSPPPVNAPATGKAPAANPPATSEKTAASDPAKEPEKPAKPHELIDGIKDPRIVAAFAETKKEADEHPEDWRAQLQYAGILQAVAEERLSNDEEKKGYETYAKSAEVARKFLDTKAEVPEIAHDLLAVVFFHDACAASRAKDTKAAMAALDESVKWGFSELSILEQDENLVAVRADAGFNQKLEKWKEAARERALKKVKEDLAAAKSFPFDFSLTDVDGKPIKLADYRGKVVIVDVWGTWCPPCRAEIPSFIKLQSTYGEKGFQMVGLNEEDGSKEETTKIVKEFMTDQKMNYPCALLDESTKNQIPELEGFPTTLFLDRSGKVRLKVVGMHEYSYLEAIVTTLLEEPASAAAPAAPEATPKK